jgi:anaerobic magnesium-protoporphyrin IX monomethyl ester cyclase
MRREWNKPWQRNAPYARFYPEVLEMRVALIYPDFPDWNVGGCYYTGMASLSASLKSAGHEVMFMHVTFPIDKEQFLHQLKPFAPDLIGFSATTPMFKYVERWAPWAKEVEGAMVIAGGIHARTDGESIIQNPAIDAVCYGEGENALVDLCDNLENHQDYTTTENFLFKEGKRVIRNPLKWIEDLDQLPDPDRDIFNHPRLYDYSKEGSPSVATFMFSRGCPFHCTFCSNPLLTGDPSGKGRIVRALSPERAIHQILDHLSKVPKTDYVRIDDTNISFDREWLTDFSKQYKAEVQKPFMCQVRIHPKLFDEEIVEMLKVSGCFLLIFGVEHGNEEYRRQVLNREMTDAQIIRAFRLCHKHRLATRAFIMLGTPYETLDLMLETLKLVARARVFDLSPTLFYPYPGTELHRVCKEKGFSVTDTSSPAWPLVVLEQPTVSRDAVYLLWRISHILLLAYASVHEDSKGDEAAMAERAMDEWIKREIDLWAAQLTKPLLEQLTRFDKRAHNIYKKAFHQGMISEHEMLLRI